MTIWYPVLYYLIRGKPSLACLYSLVFSSPTGAPDQPHFVSSLLIPPAGTTLVPNVSIVPTTPAAPDPANLQDAEPQTAPVPNVSIVPMHSL